MRLPVKFGTVVIIQYNDPNGYCPPWDVLGEAYPAISEDPLDISNYQPNDSAGASSTEVYGTAEAREAIVSSGVTMPVGSGPDSASPLTPNATPSTILAPGHAASKNTSSVREVEIVDLENEQSTEQRSPWMLCNCKICSKQCVSPQILRSHIQRSHMTAREKYPIAAPPKPAPKWQCMLCLKTVTSELSLQYHLTFVHGLEDPDAQPVEVLPSGVPMVQVPRPAAPEPSQMSNLVKRILYGGKGQAPQVKPQSGPVNPSAPHLSLGGPVMPTQPFDADGRTQEVIVLDRH